MSFNIYKRNTVQFMNKKGHLVSFDEVLINETIYLIPHRSSICMLNGDIISPYNNSPYSDHIPMSGIINIGSLTLRVCTFNACLTTMALRGVQKLHNAKGKWKGMITGDVLPIDTIHKKFVTDYIIREIVGNNDIVFLQEIDLESCEMLREAGIYVIFEPDTNINRGGNAICFTRADILINKQEPIIDKWIYKGVHGEKLVGIYCEAIVEDMCISLANFHFDADTDFKIVRKYTREKFSIIGGDFNKDIREILSEQSIELNVSILTTKDITRKRTIDGIVLFEKLENLQQNAS